MPSPYPRLNLPLKPPLDPMEAERAEEIPKGALWQYEPKWDGFRALIFRDHDKLIIQSKSGQPLARYFPELVESFLKMKEPCFILDGEIVLILDKQISFSALQLRLHPAQSRIEKLAKETPATFMAFDILHWDANSKANPATKTRARGITKSRVQKGEKLLPLFAQPLSARRKLLEQFLKKSKLSKKSQIQLSPYTSKFSKAEEWFSNTHLMGCDGVMAKNANAPYHFGDRAAMIKVKHLKSADCVVAGFRYQAGKKSVAALTLGLFDEDGLLHHVGSTSSFTLEERKTLLELLKPYEGGSGFTGRSPSGQSRWSTKDNEWIPLAPKLVCEVRYDHISDQRFRHGTKFLRWRTDKKPKACTFSQLK